MFGGGDHSCRTACSSRSRPFSRRRHCRHCRPRSRRARRPLGWSPAPAISRDLGGRADGKPVILADNLGSLSLSLPRSGSKVHSMPRSRNIWTAVGESLSDTELWGPWGLSFECWIRSARCKTGGRRVSPASQAASACCIRFERPASHGSMPDVRGLDRAAAPDAQPGRRVAVAADVQATPSVSSRFATALAKAAPSEIRGSVNFRQTEVFERVAGSVARLAIQSWRQKLEPPARWHPRAQSTRSDPPTERAQSAHPGNLRPPASRAC